ncbi:hypothetical protein [Rhodospirillum sp. A1_3_36]|uniref:DUF7716 domain-containing protein n=1 Tax=Rhodospirillum sp. A1_3_36 TaxID=3391666 RepID=UPI0039A6E21B
MMRTLTEVLENLASYSWRDWVFLDRKSAITMKSQCIVLDPDDAELGADNFTPLLVEQHAMDEFLSIQDIRSVQEHLLRDNPAATRSELCNAVCYYFENDAFFPHSAPSSGS